MTTSAVIMMIVAALLLWGGFVAAVLHLRRTPEVPDDDQGFGSEDYPRTT
ncbi:MULTISPECIES: methionine/alanine import family NSS transporter small subunit [Kocuria]|uniref:Methionine/alanine import family NSS transporter small subunit n=1 Tax=Kocuria oceani TaxID=988827 RepID=A0ABV9THI4_9MICC|nr:MULTISPECIES: methionine/alanine import family NSS transporter small subunit [Kocuria]